MTEYFTTPGYFAEVLRFFSQHCFLEHKATVASFIAGPTTNMYEQPVNVTLL